MATPIPLEHVGALHASLVARTETGQRVALTLVQSDDDDVAQLDLGIFSFSGNGTDSAKFLSTTALGRELRLFGTVADVNIDAESIDVQLGNG